VDSIGWDTLQSTTVDVIISAIDMICRLPVKIMKAVWNMMCGQQSGSSGRASVIVSLEIILVPFILLSKMGGVHSDANKIELKSK